MTATAVVNNLLEDEGFGFGQQEKAEDWEEVPYGFEATGTDRKLIVRWVPRYNGYALTVYWTDDYTGKPRELQSGITKVKPSQAHAYMAQQQERYEKAGWKFKLL